MRRLVLLFTIFLFGFSYFAVSQSLVTTNSAVTLEELATQLVTQCSDIQENEIVLIYGGVRDLELLENIAVNVRKVGAFPLLTIGSDRMTRKMYTEVPEKYDSQLPLVNFHLVNMITSQIVLPTSESPDLLVDIPPERFTTQNTAGKLVEEIRLQKNIKLVALGNGLYPTKALAEQSNISLDNLTEIFWAGINVDYKKLLDKGNELKSKLENGHKLKITKANGTDLSVKVANRKVFISDGVISEEDKKLGQAGNNVFLPAGEVYMSVVPETANGIIVVDKVNLMGKTINGLTLNFEGGKLISYDAESGLDLFKKYFEPMPEGKNEFGFINFGINPNVTIPEGSNLLNWVPAGMLSIGVGNNAWAGGDNNSLGGFLFFMPNSTVELDGSLLVEEGELK